MLPGASGVDEGGETVLLGSNGVLRIGEATVTLAESTRAFGGAVVSGLGGWSGRVYEGVGTRRTDVGGAGLCLVVGVGVGVPAVVL